LGIVWLCVDASAVDNSANAEFLVLDFECFYNSKFKQQRHAKRYDLES